MSIAYLCSMICQWFLIDHPLRRKVSIYLVVFESVSCIFLWWYGNVIFSDLVELINAICAPMKDHTTLIKEDISCKWAEQAEVKTFTVTICWHDVGHDEQTQLLSHWGKSEQQTTVRPWKATNEELYQPSVWHDERGKWGESESGREMQFQLQMVSLTQMIPFSAQIKWSHLCRWHLVFARSNGNGPVFRVTGDGAAEMERLG